MRHPIHRPSNSGFTLIEIVIVLVIIAILALMAIPSLYGVTVRQQIKDSMPLFSIGRGGVTSYFAANGEMPGTNEAAGIPEAKKIVGKYVTSVTVKDGAVTITYGNSSHAKLTGKKLIIRPVYSSDPKAKSIVPIDWVCAGRPIPGEMTAAGTDETNVPVDAIPFKCP